MKKVLLVLAMIVATMGLVACGNKEVAPKDNSETTNNSVQENTNVEVTEVPKNEQIGTAGSNIPIKDNHDEAEYEIKVAFQNWLAEAYGSDIVDARIYVEKIYTAEEEQADEGLKGLNLTANEVAFEVKYELKPAEGVDVNALTAATGVYEEESGWVTEKYNVGILRPNTNGGEAKYVVTDVGTGF